jgi:hypothetical protein
MARPDLGPQADGRVRGVFRVSDLEEAALGRQVPPGKPRHFATPEAFVEKGHKEGPVAEVSEGAVAGGENRLDLLHREPLGLRLPAHREAAHELGVDGVAGEALLEEKHVKKAPHGGKMHRDRRQREPSGLERRFR